MAQQAPSADNPLASLYEERIRRIDAALDAEIGAYADSGFAAPLRYAVRAGKRIRPLMLVLSAECVGEAGEDAYTAACAVELLHTESVIHDDIIDNEQARRGADPFHIRYGYNKAILTGDFVLGMILNASSRIGSVRVTRGLAEAAMLMSEGEVLEGEMCSRADVALADYAKVIRYKTAAAFEAAARIGAIVGGGDGKHIDSAAAFGRSVGIAYQIRDDLADWNNEDKIFNALIRQHADPRGAFNDVERMLRAEVVAARTALRGLPDNAARADLERLAGLAVPT